MEDEKTHDIQDVSVSRGNIQLKGNITQVGGRFRQTTKLRRLSFYSLSTLILTLLVWYFFF